MVSWITLTTNEGHLKHYAGETLLQGSADFVVIILGCPIFCWYHQGEAHYSRWGLHVGYTCTAWCQCWLQQYHCGMESIVIVWNLCISHAAFIFERNLAFHVLQKAWGVFWCEHWSEHFLFLIRDIRGMERLLGVPFYLGGMSWICNGNIKGGSHRMLKSTCHPHMITWWSDVILTTIRVLFMCYSYTHYQLNYILTPRSSRRSAHTIHIW